MESAAELDHEVKFVLPASAVAAARLLLRAAARPEQPYPAGVVESIYFDTPRLDALAEKRASDYRKAKLRLRWYDGGGAVFFESKVRTGSRRAKRRAIAGLDGAELSRVGLPAARFGDPAALALLLGEPLAADLSPVVHLRYRRERFVVAGGPRVNLDTALEVRGVAPRWGGGPIVTRLAAAVLELKGAGRELPPVLASLARLGCRRGSYSKYAAAIAALGV